ncbi:hypothetical protein CW304_08350 [Bacillus sp. UFRGS-B20]|nr:hypothetical protein CW304_08350 [Bacillus sp. UFRGS-B20]
MVFSLFSRRKLKIHWQLKGTSRSQKLLYAEWKCVKHHLKHCFGVYLSFPVDRYWADVRLVESSVYIWKVCLTGGRVPVQKKLEALQGQVLPLGSKNMLLGHAMITRGSGKIGVATVKVSDGQIAIVAKMQSKWKRHLQRRFRITRKNINYCSSYLTSARCIGWVYQGNDSISYELF